jgi:phosphoglycolate phosphatase
VTLICLDLDGTLEDSRVDMTASARRVRSLLDLPVRPDAELVRFVSQGMDTLYKNCFDDYLAGDGDSAGRYREVQRAYDADYMAHVADNTELYDGVADAVKELSELGSVAVVTNKPEAISRKLLELLGIAQYVEVIVGGDTCGVIKPDPKMIQTAAERLNMAGAPAVMIGDTAGDIRMGRAYGAKTIWCAWGYADDSGDPPDAHATKPSDLPGIIRNFFDFSFN